MQMFVEYTLNDFIELGQIFKIDNECRVKIEKSDRGPDVNIYGIKYEGQTNFTILEEAYRLYSERDDTSKNKSQLTH